MNSTLDWPRITLATPCRNASVTIEHTIHSILDQSYPNLEYMIGDALSIDSTVEIIQKFEPNITHWESISDNGPYDALNRLFGNCTGEIMGWLNADDVLLPGALRTVADIFRTFPEVKWITTLFPLTLDQSGLMRNCRPIPGFSEEAFASGEYTSEGEYGWIQQESTFWRRTLWEASGGSLRTEYDLAADFELWARFFRYAPLHGVGVPLAAFRRLPAQRSRDAAGYNSQCLQILRSNRGTRDKKPRFLRSWPLIGRLSRSRWSYNAESIFSTWDECQMPSWRLRTLTF